MTLKCVPCLLGSLAVIALGPPTVDAATYDLYYLGGQSNMDGYGNVADLPAELQGTVEGVMIFHGNPAPDSGPADGRGAWADAFSRMASVLSTPPTDRSRTPCSRRSTASTTATPSARTAGHTTAAGEFVR